LGLFHQHPQDTSLFGPGVRQIEGVSHQLGHRRYFESVPIQWAEQLLGQLGRGGDLETQVEHPRNDTIAGKGADTWIGGLHEGDKAPVHQLDHHDGSRSFALSLREEASQGEEGLERAGAFLRISGDGPGTRGKEDGSRSFASGSGEF